MSFPAVLWEWKGQFIIVPLLLLLLLLLSQPPPLPLMLFVAKEGGGELGSLIFSHRPCH